MDHRKSKRIPEKHLLLLHWLCQSCWLYGSHQTVENSQRDGNIRPPYLSPEKPVCGSISDRTLHGKNDWFKIGKGVHQGCILSPCLFNFHAEYIMQNARLDESQDGIKIARRNINNLRYADDMTLMEESEEELNSLLMRVKEESKKAALKLNISRVNQITSPGWMHETSPRTWCSARTWSERVEREVGGGIGMGKTCKLKDVSFQCMTKFTTN